MKDSFRNDIDACQAVTGQIFPSALSTSRSLTYQMRPFAHEATIVGTKRENLCDVFNRGRSKVGSTTKN